MTQNLKNLPSHVDNRGLIQAILEQCNVGSITCITSEPNTERANHWHRDPEGHTILITEGEIWIYEVDINSLELKDHQIKKTVLKVGDIHWTGPNVAHTMFFPVKNSFYCFSVLPRDPESYEKNTVRIPTSLKSIYDASPYING
ncbi:hypothetical protein [Flavobacterium sp.]|uniref:hypothetical protein n=1 Tax=Flavobacterium sp. TaxID=239 RepID=UPI0038FC3AB1